MLQISGKGGWREEQAMGGLCGWIDERLDTVMYSSVCNSKGWVCKFLDDELNLTCAPIIK